MQAASINVTNNLLDGSPLPAYSNVSQKCASDAAASDAAILMQTSWTAQLVWNASIAISSWQGITNDQHDRVVMM